MPEANYDEVISEIKSLKLADQLRLLEEMANLIRKRTNKNSICSSDSECNPSITYKKTCHKSEQ